jgi:GrpB-like predicted nucleotidyltransferase (UPF0157 family)
MSDSDGVVAPTHPPNARTKRELATRRWNYVQEYADAKTDVVEAIIARAVHQ